MKLKKKKEFLICGNSEPLCGERNRQAMILSTLLVPCVGVFIVYSSSEILLLVSFFPLFPIENETEI